MDNIPRRKMPFGLIEKSPKILNFKSNENLKKVESSEFSYWIYHVYIAIAQRKMNGK